VRQADQIVGTLHHHEHLPPLRHPQPYRCFHFLRCLAHALSIPHSAKENAQKVTGSERRPRRFCDAEGEGTLSGESLLGSLITRVLWPPSDVLFLTTGNGPLTTAWAPSTLSTISR
jgi:hypothetical protein